MSLTSGPLICISGDWNSATSISHSGQVAAGYSYQRKTLEGAARWQKGISHFSLPFLLLAVSQAVAAAVSVCGLPALCSKSVVSEVAAAVGTWKLLNWFQRKLWWAGDSQLLGSWLHAG